MENDQIAKDNHAFFYVAVGMALCSAAADAAVVHSFFQNGKSQCEIDSASYPGCMHINSADVVDMHLCGCLAEKVHKGILGEVAMKIPLDGIKGELNDKAEIIHDKYRFSFAITNYARDRDHDFELVENNISLPEDEHLGRVVELRISPL